MECSKYKLGLVSVSFRTHEPKEIIEAARAAGLSCIEWGSDIHAPCRNAERLAQIAALQKEYGIRCCSYGTYFRLGETPLDELTDYIAAAKMLGTNILRLWCGTKSGADMTADEKKDLLSVCRKAADIAKEHGVTLCMECHIKTLTEQTKDALWLMQEVNASHFRMYWQPNQFRTEAKNLASAQILAPYTKTIHVFNWEGRQKLPLMDAAETWRRYLSCFDGSQGLLLEFMPDGELTTLGREAEALRAIVDTEKMLTKGE
ncbi:MAG: sugar phosphate isomerase/epimerase [Clostridia bacterium]|nr:sugar phosphate isomerase/epimerase [Clostridia bacterium]